MDEEVIGILDNANKPGMMGNGFNTGDNKSTPQSVVDNSKEISSSDKKPAKIINNFKGNVAYKPEDGTEPVIIGEGVIIVGIDGLNVDGWLYKVPDEVTEVLIRENGTVILRSDGFIDWLKTEAKILDFRIIYLDDWQPIKHVFDE